MGERDVARAHPGGDDRQFVTIWFVAKLTWLTDVACEDNGSKLLGKQGTSEGPGMEKADAHGLCPWRCCPPVSHWSMPVASKGLVNVPVLPEGFAKGDPEKKEALCCAARTSFKKKSSVECHHIQRCGLTTMATRSRGR